MSPPAIIVCRAVIDASRPKTAMNHGTPAAGMNEPPGSARRRARKSRIAACHVLTSRPSLLSSRGTGSASAPRARDRWRSASERALTASRRPGALVRLDLHRELPRLATSQREVEAEPIALPADGRSIEDRGRPAIPAPHVGEFDAALDQPGRHSSDQRRSPEDLEDVGEVGAELQGQPQAERSVDVAGDADPLGQGVVDPTVADHGHAVRREAPHGWIGEVEGRVAVVCRPRREPVQPPPSRRSTQRDRKRVSAAKKPW